MRQPKSCEQLYCIPKESHKSKYMKKELKILVLALTISFLNVNGQSVEAKIEKQFLDYSSLMIDKKYEKALGYTDEEFFKIIPKEQLITLLTKALNSSEMEYKAHLPTLSNFQETKNINGKNYVKFKSSTLIEIKMTETEEDKDNTEEDKKLKLSLYKLSFENTFGVGNVKFNEETNFFEIKTNKNVIASSNEKMEKWKFVIVEERQKKLLERFIPKELID